ncbi:SDR family oxidoreductase [Amycolatopsis acidicola]|uniref:SDR family oxidoreductase n=1 Tax=Amycolatopsis acidicola TaxID=2596893 RepID=A0A5N0V130_9PSEU|nr:SDR family oxidoreductase [Amycolatopsis acidicola]KAA9160096.1 SDR family oxidoreductase [Amycolatopsis acidicola]
MKVFLTGASGGIGAALVPELVAAGHEVLGLVRSDASARAVAAAGATPFRGDLNDPESLRAGAAQADGVVHLAFDASDFATAVEKEALAVETFGAVLAGTGKALFIASGTPAADGRAATEEDPANTSGPLGSGPLAGRARNAQYVLSLADKDVRSGIVRLPRAVHSRDARRYGLASGLIGVARQAGVSGYVGDGSQRWPAVHSLDAAKLFRLLLEQAEPGTVAHAVSDEGIPLRDIAAVIGRRLGLPVESVSEDRLGPFGALAGVDQPASSELTRKKFGWQPTHPGLLDDLEAGDYPG